MSNRCPSCRAFVWWDESHKCAPAWLVYNPDHSEADDARTVHAHDAAEAAEKWAERDDAESAEYAIVAGNDAVVLVKRDEENAAWERWRVSGETVPSYHALPEPAEDTPPREGGCPLVGCRIEGPHRHDEPGPYSAWRQP